MKRKLHKDDVVEEILRDADVGIEKGMTVEQVLDAAGASLDATLMDPPNILVCINGRWWRGTVEFCLEPASAEEVRDAKVEAAEA